MPRGSIYGRMGPSKLDRTRRGGEAGTAAGLRRDGAQMVSAPSEPGPAMASLAPPSKAAANGARIQAVLSCFCLTH